MFDIEKDFNPGALKDVPDYRALTFGAYEDVVGVTDAPSWSQGFDVEANKKILSPKNQAKTLSCVGNAWGSYSQILDYLETGKSTPFSAQSIYSMIYLEQGGAYVKDGAARIVSTGINTEQDFPTDYSSEEAIRVRPSKIQEELANPFKAKSFAQVKPDLEEARRAIFAGNGAVTAFTGDNVGWMKDKGWIQPPGDNAKIWGHCVLATKYGLTKDGKRYIGGINSWGEGWGDKGYWYATEDYFTANNGSLVWSFYTLVDLPNKYKSKFMFNLLKGSGANVYAVRNNVRHLIVNFDTFKAGSEKMMWGKQEDIGTVTDTELALIPEGEAILLFPNN